jgi:phage-related protein
MGKLGVKAFSSMARGAMMAGRMMLANPIILIIALIAGAAYLIYKNWDKIAPFIKKVWDKASKAVSDAWTKIKNYVSNGAQAILNYIKNLAIVKWLKEKWDAATAMMRGAVKTFTTVGGDIVAGLWNGLKAKFGAVLDWVREKTAAIATAAKSALGINSPSRVFMSIGHDTMAGLHAGLDKNHGKVLGNVRKLAQSMGGVPMRLQAAGMQAGAPAMNPTASFKPARAAAGNAGGFSFTFSGDIVIHADKDTNTASIAATVRREIEAVAREAASRARGSFMDRD